MIALVTTSRVYLRDQLRAHVCLIIGKLTCSLFSDSPSELREASSRLQVDHAAGRQGMLVLDGAVVQGIPRTLLQQLAGNLEAAACELDNNNQVADAGGAR